jgi:hypothetical protein
MAPAYLAVGIISLGDAMGIELPRGANLRTAAHALVSYMDTGDRGPRYLNVPIGKVVLEAGGAYERLEAMLDRVTVG